MEDGVRTQVKEEVEFEGRMPQAKECLGLREADEDKEDLSSVDFRGNVALLPP